MTQQKIFDFIPPHHSHRKMIRKKRWGKRALISISIIPALYLLASAAVFIGLRFHLTDVPGVVDPQSEVFQEFITNQQVAAPLVNGSLPSVEDSAVAADRVRRTVLGCKIDVLARSWPKNAERIAEQKKLNVATTQLERMLFAVQLRLPPSDPILSLWKECETPNAAVVFPPQSTTTSDIFPWMNTPEWETVSTAFTKDQKTVKAVSAEIGIEPRTLVSVAMVEQLRLYFTQREVFKKFFQPLKVLGNATQFAWGVMAIKEATAIDIEAHLTDTKSPWYLGPKYERALAYQAGADTAKERFARLTNEGDHSWSYRYGGIELLQFLSQWKRAKHSIEDRPEIIATLFNIGFGHSHPSDHPSVGGSTLSIADTKYTFGALAYEWYYSGALASVFPYQTTLPK